MRCRPRKSAVAAILLGVALLAAEGVQAAETRFFRIGTGSTAGTYFPIGSLIASAISRPPGSAPCHQGGACGVDGLIAMAVTSLGSYDNIQGLASGRFDSVLAQSDSVAWAYRGNHVFTGTQAYPNLRVIANLYPEHIHLVTRRHIGVRGVSDLKGRRVAVDRVGSGTRINAMLILKAYGLEPTDVEVVNLGPVDAIGALLDGEIDAAFFVVGYPSTAVTELTDSGRFTVVPIAGVAAEQLATTNRYYTLSEIPADVYAGVGAVQTLSVGAQWIVDAEVDPDLVYKITAALWRPENREVLDSGHEKGRQIRLESALDGLTIPLHPGAERYYREMGLID